MSAHMCECMSGRVSMSSFPCKERKLKSLIIWGKNNLNSSRSG